VNRFTDRWPLVAALLLVFSACSGDSSSTKDLAPGGDGAIAGDHGIADQAANSDLTPKSDGPAPLADGSAPDGLAPALCGDGVTQTGEECDLGSLNSLLPDAGCRPNCTLKRCGDGIKDSGEGCDDGNQTDGDGCSKQCQAEGSSGLSISPTQLHFGALGLGCEGPKTLELTLSNATAAPIAITSIALSACSSDFTLTNGGAKTVSPGASTTIQVTFVPGKVGTQSCSLNVVAGALVQVPLTVAVNDKPLQTDSFLQQLNRKVDFLFLVDGGGSMMEEQSVVAASAGVFLQALKANKVDYQVGFVQLAPEKPIDLGVLKGNPPFLTAATPNFQQAFSAGFMLAGGSDESGFTSAVEALSPPQTGTIDPNTCSACAAPNLCIDGACRGSNWGFHRSDASLEILAFTDEDDTSTLTAAETLVFLKGQVNPLLGTFVRVNGIIPNSACAGSATFPKWKALITDTGGVLNDLCAKDFGPAFKTMADRLFGLQDQFYLSRATDGSALSVTVNGQLTTAYAFDSASDSITFVTAPADGSLIDVSYKPSCN
jgi:cysteine-rich repeat protein